MKVKLQRHGFIDKQDWILVFEDIPLGTEYEVLELHQNVTIQNILTGEVKQIDCYLVDGNGGMGLLPCEIFEILH